MHGSLFLYRRRGRSDIIFLLLNTARKVAPSTNITGKKALLPVYISLADQPEAIIEGMNKLKVDAQKTETARDRWRWIPRFIFLGGIGLVLIDVVLWLLGYTSFIFIVEGGMISFVANSPFEEVEHENTLSILQSAYTVLKRKAA